MIRCNICYQGMDETDDQINCPRCQNEFHREHLAAWVLNNDFCPACRNTLSDTFREDLRPKTEKERQRLQDVYHSLDRLGELLEDVETSSRYSEKIKQRRMEELGVDPISIGDILKVSIPFLIIIAAIFVVFLALSGEQVPI